MTQDPLAFFESDFELAMTQLDATQQLESSHHAGKQWAQQEDRQLEGEHLATSLQTLPSGPSPETQFYTGAADSGAVPPEVVTDPTTALLELIQQFQGGNRTETDIDNSLNAIGKASYDAVDTSNPTLLKLKNFLDNNCSFGLRNDPIGRLWAAEIKNDPNLANTYAAAKGHKAKEQVLEGAERVGVQTVSRLISHGSL